MRKVLKRVSNQRATLVRRLERLEDRLAPAVTHFAAVGADFGALPQVRVLDGRTGAERFNFLAYDQSFRGGVRVAAGDVTGDAVDDLITAAGHTGGPHVKVFNGATGQLAREFFAYDPSFLGGVNVAAGDVNGDGFADIITGAGTGGGPHIKVFSGKDGSLLRQFFAYDASFHGGVNVGAGDINGDGRDDIVTGAGYGGGPHVRAFSGASGKLLDDFFAYNASFHGGVYVAAGDADDDGRADIVTGPGASGGPHVKIFSGQGATLIQQFFVNPGTSGLYFGGVRVAAGYANADSRLDVLTTTGVGGDSLVRAYDALTGSEVSELPAFTPSTSAGAAFVCCPSLPDSNSVLDWNTVALRAIQTDKTPPPKSSRNLAIMHVAIEEAFEQIALSLFPAGTVISFDATAASAAHRVLTTLFPAQTANFDRYLNGCLALIPDGPGKTTSISIGQNAADAELSARANDGSSATVSYTPTGLPGDWAPTPAANAPFLLPQWGAVTPFVMTSNTQFRPAAPPTIDSAAYATAFNEVKDLGSKTSTTRTPDQTQIALFWADGSGTVTPPGHWNQIANGIARQRGMAVTDTANLFAKLNKGLADAAIVAWDAKLEYDYWRPVTAIRKADTDSNDATSIDAAWTSLITTPPFPSYTSGHSTFSGLGATILDYYLGAGVPFRTYSYDLPDVSRAFGNFQAAADEAGMSRIYGGIHFQFDNVAGLASGRALGAFVLS